MSSFLMIPKDFFNSPIWKGKRKFSKAECLIDILHEIRYSKETERVMIAETFIKCEQGQSLNIVRNVFHDITRLAI